MRRNVVIEKSFEFAVLVVRLGKFLTLKKREYILSKQLIRSGTSVGANVEEAHGSQSRKEFRAKMFIAYRELRETIYWIRLLEETKFISKEEGSIFMLKSEELSKIFGAILKTTKS